MSESGCSGGCANCSGACKSASGPKVERESCQTCPNRVTCHGKAPFITQDTVLRLVRDTVRTVVAEWEAAGRL
jgi:hypothetical protein